MLRSPQCLIAVVQDVVGNEVSAMLLSLNIGHTRRVTAASMAVTIEIALPQHQVIFAPLFVNRLTALPYLLL